MGADIQVSGRVAVVRGVEALTGARVHTRDLRAGAGALHRGARGGGGVRRGERCPDRPGIRPAGGKARRAGRRSPKNGDHRRKTLGGDPIARADLSCAVPAARGCRGQRLRLQRGDARARGRGPGVRGARSGGRGGPGRHRQRGEHLQAELWRDPRKDRRRPLFRGRVHRLPVSGYAAHPGL